jgi:hypothetical protein
MCAGDRPLDLQKAGTFQVIVPISRLEGDGTTTTAIDSVTIPIRLSGNFKLALKFIEFNVNGAKNVDLDLYAVFRKSPLVTFTSPNFIVPLTVNNALTYVDGTGLKKVGDINGISTILDINFSSHGGGGGGGGGGSATGDLKCAMSKPGPPHMLLASINNSFTIQPMYLLSPNDENYKTTSQLIGLNTTFGGNKGSYILTFDYDAI